ncbi:MAG TPA: PstS family phosphate ABC transporter substrate-binding protein [Planctomycetota bacterium]|nr:PstS family phosphate ABC transporter substrate-binding protein [Planctomycetota bacterium]
MDSARRGALLGAVAAGIVGASAAGWFLLRQDEPAPSPPPSALPAPPPPKPPAPARRPLVDPDIPDYACTERIKGTLRSAGSDTMNNLMTMWAEGFREHHPEVWIEIAGKGSSTAPPALIAGVSEFGPMSREMKAKEVEEFRKKFGYEPVGVATSIDMLAVFVHRDNPIAGLSLPQVDAIFSKDRKGGFGRDIATWGDAGLTGEWADKPITLYGRNTASGTYGYFKQTAILGGDFKDSIKEQPGSSKVVQEVAGDRHGIGYAGIGYKTPGVKAVALAAKDGTPFVEAHLGSAYSGAYPLYRYLLLYVNVKPGEPLDPMRREFLRFVFSRQGQEAVVMDGYYPLVAAVCREQLARAGVR